jgi:hypothetical protein
MDRVHVSVNRPGALGPQWTDAGADNGHGGAKQRGRHGEIGSGLTGARAAAWRPGDGGGAKRSRELGGEGFHRRRGEEKGSVRYGVLRGSSGWLL